ncbi:MAG TPA: winged helix-turn-helix domain-containing protein [Chloroflexota bacterium]|nr:winged helix-turn-helix domain-containing protein [Chloroflexota bacterium]
MSDWQRSRGPVWEAPVTMVRVGDIVLIKGEGSARLARVVSSAQAASALEPTDEQRLPAKEASLLAFLMRHHRQVVSKSRLIEAVWGQGGAGPGVLDVHIARLRRVLQRLDPSGEQARIETFRGMGYSLHVDGPSD